MSPISYTPPYAPHLLVVVNDYEPRLLALSDDDSRVRVRPGGWSRREVIGHLIDSAAINNDRFVRVQRQSDMVLAGYDQDFWVAAQRYHDADWHSLVQLWALHNRQIARVMLAVPDDVRYQIQTRHNLDQIAFRTVPADQPTTLDYLMNDYVAHLEHHVSAILAPTWGA